MSRNLCTTICPHCGDTPRLVETPHFITNKESGAYYEEFEGMIVAKAICPSCEAQYLSWTDESHRTRYARDKSCPTVEDLSYYSTFNDEPDEDDLPRYEIQYVRIRVAKIR